MHNKNTDAALDSVYRQLESFYIGYENWAARRIAPLGNFRSFVRHVLEKLSKAAPAKKQRIVDLANKWRRRFVLEQLGLLAAILTVAAAALDTLLFVFYFCASGANFLFPHSAFSAALFETIPQVPYPILTLPLIAFFLGIFFWKARLYLSTFWADVMFWTTQEEKSIYFSKRREILRAATHALSHVLQDNNCRRVVVIGHSLGSAIAYESLLRLGRRRLARESSGSMPIELARLDIVSHLVTIGSPIDWIHYFFELHDSRFHRYNRIRDILKGSTDSIPFKNNGEACTRWINIWDDADPMSTKLFSPRGRTPNARAIYDLWAPSSHCMGPATAHTGYFMSEISVQALLWISMFGRLPKELEVGRIFRGVQAFIFNFVRPGMKLLAALLVWIALICGTMFLFFDASWSILLFPAAILLILIVGWVATLLADQMWPLRFDGAVP